MDNEVLYIINMLLAENEFLTRGPEHEHNVLVEQSIKVLGFVVDDWKSSDDDTPVSFWSLERKTKKYRRYPDVPKEFKPGSNSNVVKSDEWLMHQNKKGRMYVLNELHENLEFAYTPNNVEKKHIEEVELAFTKLGLTIQGTFPVVKNKMDKSPKTSPKFWLIDFINKSYTRAHTNENSLYLPTESSIPFLHRVRGKVHSRDFGI